MRELDKAKKNMRSADLDLAALELKQVQKMMEKYNVPALGNLKTEKPEGYKIFKLTQLHSMSTKLQVKMDQSTRLLNRYGINMQAVL